VAVAKVDTPNKVAADSLETVTKKLEDTFRGVERLRAAIAIVGEAYSQLYQQLNFATAHLDDIPDREALRKAVETLEAEATAKVSRGSTANGATNAPSSNAPTAKELGETRFALMREA
jgi:hypothetical protein